MELFSPGPYADKRICVALSGGADSVCLLHAFYTRMQEFRITLSAVHIEHGIRGEESLRDMRFCEELCARLNVPLRVKRVDVPSAARERGRGIEETARAVRYGVFRSLIDGGKADLVATAHHANDVAETVLFRLARGTGLSGMKTITEYGGIVRPLLSVTRDEILEYVRENSLPFVEDSTNGDENYTRNYIRRTVLPAFEKIHGNAAKHLVRFAELAAEEDAFLQDLAEKEIVRVAGEERVPVDLPDVLFRRACLSCLRQTAPSDGCARANLDEIVKLRTAQSGKKIAVPADEGQRAFAVRYAFREGNDIVFDWERKDPPRLAETPFLPQTGDHSEPSPFSVREIVARGEENIAEERRKTGYLRVDLDAFPQGCVVRTRREGDFIVPYGGRKKTLKRFFTEKKISARLGKKLPLIANGPEILVAVGVEISDKVKVTERTVRQGVIG